MCQPYSVRKGTEISPTSFNPKATDSNSDTIFPTPKAGRLPPFTAVDLSSEKRSATSEKSSPFLSNSAILLILSFASFDFLSSDPCPDLNII